MENIVSHLKIIVICDKIGQTASNIAQRTMEQFPELTYQIKTYSFIDQREKIDSLIPKMIQLKGEDACLVFHAISDEEQALYLSKILAGYQIPNHDILRPAIQKISEITGTRPTNQPNSDHQLNEQYFNRIRALEYAVIHDDGQNPSGYSKADILILGVSRTSKTPLSIYLANQGFKVANLPIMPEAEIPKELWQIDRQRIFGLTNDLKILMDIRKDRLISYGMDENSHYSDEKRIQRELQFADDLYQRIGCEVINVANRSIEETASLIINHTKAGLVVQS